MRLRSRWGDGTLPAVKAKLAIDRFGIDNRDGSMGDHSKHARLGCASSIGVRDGEILAAASFWIYLVHHPILGIIHIDLKWLLPDANPVLEVGFGIRDRSGYLLIELRGTHPTNSGRSMARICMVPLRWR